MFLKLTKVDRLTHEDSGEEYFNFDKVCSFERGDGWTFVYYSPDGDVFDCVKETTEQIMEMLNGCEQAVKTTSVLYGENGIKLNELTV